MYIEQDFFLLCPWSLSAKEENRESLSEFQRNKRETREDQEEEEETRGGEEGAKPSHHPCIAPFRVFQAFLGDKVSILKSQPKYDSRAHMIDMLV